MMVRNKRQKEVGFSVRSQLDFQDVSHIFTGSRVKIRRLHDLLVYRLIHKYHSGAIVHVCPWSADDVERYLALDAELCQFVIWKNQHMNTQVACQDNVRVIPYTSIDPTERFIVISGKNTATALISWDHQTTADVVTDVKTVGAVFVLSPRIAQNLVHRLRKKLIRLDKHMAP
jgi:hypothetical protein